MNLNKLDEIQKLLTEVKELTQARHEAEEAAGGKDEELLHEIMTVLEYATFHDGRYGQVGNYERFQKPACRLVRHLEKRLKREAYA